MNTRNWIVVHHTGSVASLDSWQFNAVKAYHVRKGWGDIGYPWFIEYDGTLKAGRPEHKPGAHTWQWLMNYRSVGVCLAGNFDEQDPSPQQIQTLKELLTDIQTRNGIPNGRIKPHRFWASYKSCPGKRFTQQFLDSVIFSRGMRGRIIVKPQPDLNPTRE